MNTEQRARLAEIAAWHLRMNLELSDKGSEWAAKEMYACQHGKFATTLERALSPPASAGEGFVCVGWEFSDPRDGMGWQRLHWLSPESVPPSAPPVEMRRVYVAMSGDGEV